MRLVPRYIHNPTPLQVAEMVEKYGYNNCFLAKDGEEVELMYYHLETEEEAEEAEEALKFMADQEEIAH